MSKPYRTPAPRPLREGQDVVLAIGRNADGEDVYLPAVVLRVDHPLTAAQRRGRAPLDGPYTTFRATTENGKEHRVVLLNETLDHFVREA